MSRRTDREAEERAQRVPLERAKRLQAFKLATEHRVWHYDAASGMTLLIDAHDGTMPICSSKPLDPFHNRYVA